MMCTPYKRERICPDAAQAGAYIERHMNTRTRASEQGRGGGKNRDALGCGCPALSIFSVTVLDFFLF